MPASTQHGLGVIWYANKGLAMAGTINRWNNQINGSVGDITLNSGTNAISIATDASATTVNIGTGGAAKIVTLGSTNSTSSTAIKSGSNSIVYNGGLTVDSSGRIVNSVQPDFLYNMLADQTNVTGDGTLYTVTFTTKIKDQNNNFDGTSTFTAPITGTYVFYWGITMTGLTSAMTNDVVYLSTSARQYRSFQTSIYPVRAPTTYYLLQGSAIASMTASDTATIKMIFSNGTKVLLLQGQTNSSFNSVYFGGYLAC